MTYGEEYIKQRFESKKDTLNQFVLSEKALIDMLDDFYNYLCKVGEIDNYL